MNPRFAHWIATCGPIGKSKVAPGTLGSLAALFIVLLTNGHSAVLIASLLVLFFVAVWSSGVTARDLGEHDPSVVVIDEVCGIMVSFLFVPIDWRTLVVGFVGFRFFDVLKPPPLRLLEQIPKGFGIVLDDLAAGIYTNLVLQILIRYAHL